MNHKPSQLSTTKVLRVRTCEGEYHGWFIVSTSKVLRVGEVVPRGTFFKKVLTLEGALIVFGHVLLGPAQSKYFINST